jgi:hypothetical protein
MPKAERRLPNDVEGVNEEGWANRAENALIAHQSSFFLPHHSAISNRPSAII